MSVAKEQKNDARRKGSRPSKREAGKVPFADFRFVRIEFTASERDDCRSQLEVGEFEHVSIRDYNDEGYKVTFAKDRDGDTYLCSVSMPHSDHHNAGLILTGRGKNPDTALGVVSYKHLVLCEDTLWREAEDRRGGSYQDIG